MNQWFSFHSGHTLVANDFTMRRLLANATTKDNKKIAANAEALLHLKTDKRIWRHNFCYILPVFLSNLFIQILLFLLEFNIG